MRKQKRELKKGRVEIDKLFVFILVLLAVVLAILIISKFGILEKIKSFLPDYFKVNQTIPGYESCPEGSAYIGYVDGNNYVNVNEKKTNIYFSGNLILLNDGSMLSKDPQIGVINFERFLDIKIPENLEEYEPEYRTLFPDSASRKLIWKAFISDDNGLCLDNARMQKIEKEESCVLTCSLADGVCSKSPVQGKIAYKKLDCPEEQTCYVDEKEDKLVSGGLKIRDDSYMDSLISPEPYNTPGKVLKEITKSNSFEITPADRLQMWIWMDYSDSFCYAFDTNGITLDKGYREYSGSNTAISSSRWSYSDEKFIHFIAWNNNKNQKVVKRWKIDSRGLAKQYEDGEIITDNEFMIKAVGGAEGARFYILGLNRMWEAGGALDRKGVMKRTYDFMIVKDSVTKISIYTHDRENKVWHQLYCNKAWINWYPPYSMNIKNAGDSLSETLDKSCMWEF